MAGRGVDIKIGEGVRELGGLYVLGTERHESRRIDNQLRGRSGRQGDPGETRFYLSGEDDLVRLFAGDRIKGIMERFKIPDDQPMEAKILSRQIEGAQKKVEEQNFVMRKNVLKYDDVMNRHRGRIYEQRRQVLEGEDMSEQVKLWIDEIVEETVLAVHAGGVRGGVGSRGADERDGRSCTGPRSPPQELREDLAEITREALIEEFQADARDEYDGEGGGVRLTTTDAADARARAVRDPPGRRRPLARAPREHGLPARGRAPALDGAEGSARRVHAEGERMFNELGRAIAARSCCTSSTRSSRPRRREHFVQEHDANETMRYERATRPTGAEAIAQARRRTRQFMAGVPPPAASSSRLMRELERFVNLQVVDVLLVRAPREHGLPARGRAPPLDGAEGSARRVHGRGRAHVHRPRPRDPRRGRAAPLPRGARARGGAAARTQTQTANGNLQYEHETAAGAEAIDAARRRAAACRPRRASSQQAVQASPHEKLGRNDPCWCGSGKKFKQLPRRP